MKKLIAPLLLLPSLAFAHTSSVSFPIDGECRADYHNSYFYLRISNLSSQAANIQIDLFDESGSAITSMNSAGNKFPGHFTELTVATPVTIPANSTVYYHTAYHDKYSEAYTSINPCTKLPIMGQITHLDSNSKILATGYTIKEDYNATDSTKTKRTGPFTFNINNGQPF